MNTIVIPTDFSEYADHAVQFGVELARLTGAKLDVIHSVPAMDDWLFSPVDDDLGVGSTDQMMNEAKSRLDDLASDPAYGDVTLSTHLYNESAHQAILEHVNNEKADLLLMGSHGRSGFSKFFLGSTNQKIMRLGNCPVITIKGMTSVNDLQNLLFVSDFEEDVSEVFQQFKSIEERIGGHLDILTVLTPLTKADQSVNTEYFGKIAKNDYRNAYTVQIHAYQTVEDGVLAFANDNDYGAIALGTHARQGLSRLLHWSSIAENLANHAPYPVVTARI